MDYEGYNVFPMAIAQVRLRSDSKESGLPLTLSARANYTARTLHMLCLAQVPLGAQIQTQTVSVNDVHGFSCKTLKGDDATKAIAKGGWFENRKRLVCLPEFASLPRHCGVCSKEGYKRRKALGT